jgi:hypothetical protein
MIYLVVLFGTTIFDISKTKDMKNNHPTTETLNAQIGGVYSYTNKGGYTTTLRVSRVTEKSIFVYRLLNNGTFSNEETREGVTTFKKYTHQNNL